MSDLCLGFRRSSYGTDTCTGGNLLEQFSVKLVSVTDKLHIIYSRTIVKSDEVNSLAAAVGTHPTLYANILAELCAFKDVYNFCSFHR